jgi:hypothetical protein
MPIGRIESLLKKSVSKVLRELTNSPDSFAAGQPIAAAFAKGHTQFIVAI